MQLITINKDTIRTLAAGDHEVFHRVFCLFHPKVYAFALGLLKNESDAEEVAQLVFIKLWTKRSMLKEVKNFNTYLYTITKNTVLNHLATRKAFTVDIAGMGDRVTGSATPQEQVEARDLQLLIDMVVENMPPQAES